MIPLRTTISTAIMTDAMIRNHSSCNLYWAAHQGMSAAQTLLQGEPADIRNELCQQKARVTRYDLDSNHVSFLFMFSCETSVPAHQDK